MRRLVHIGMADSGAWIPDFNRVIESYLRLHKILSVLFLSDKEFRQTIRYFESRVLTRAHEPDSCSTDKIIYLTREVFKNLSFFFN